MISHLHALRLAGRSLTRTPRFTVLAVATLALGIGITTAFFSVFDAVLLQPLPYTEADRLVTVLEAGRSPTSPANFEDLRQRSGTLRDLTAASPWNPVWTIDGHVEQIAGLMATPSLFDLLAAEALHGRIFSAKGDEPPSSVIVLSYALWQRRFGGDLSLLGRAVDLDGEPHTIVGIMPEGFAFPPFWATGAEFWVPHDQDHAMWSNRGAQFLRVFARLAPGLEPGTAQAEIDLLAAELAAEHPRENDGLGYLVEPLQEPVVDGVRPMLWTLFGAVGMVGLIACANAASLWWTRATVRRRDLGIRRALGAGPRQVLALGLAEGFVLMILATGIGSLLAVWGVDALLTLAPPDVPRLDEIGINSRALGFAVAAATALLIGFALVPTRVGRQPLRAALSTGGRSAGDRGGERLRSAVVAAQIALALVLLISAGLMARSLHHVINLDPGMRTDGVLTMTLPFEGTAWTEPEAQIPFLERVTTEIAALPGVERAAVINHLHLGGDLWGYSFEAEGQPVDSPANAPNASQRVADTEVFAALDIQLVSGRTFDHRDHADASPTVVVNQTLADTLWPDRAAVGQRLRGLGDDEPWRTVIGVVQDVRQWSLVDPIRPEIYFPYTQNPNDFWHQTTLVVTTAGTEIEPMSLLPAIEARLGDIAPGVPAARPRSLATITHQLVWQPRFAATLMALFGAAAIGLAWVGIYGTMAYSAALRRAELGVRAALGADRRRLLTLLLGRGAQILLLGVGTGALLAIAGGRLLTSQVHGISIYDPATWILATAAVAAAALLAVLGPAWRASRANIVEVLRQS